MTDLEALLGATSKPDSCSIPVQTMFVRWDRDPETDKVTRVRVMNAADQPEGSVKEQYDSGGCLEMGWMADSLGTPLALFAQLLVYGFASRKDMQAALHQFRNIHGQEVWATFLLELSGDTDIERIVGEEMAEGKGSPLARRH